jgi:1,4-alpha-glucan branching enzyme
MTSLDHITEHTPMGANLVKGGATFRVWAPRATAIYVVGDFNHWTADGNSQLNPLPNGHWAGFVSGVTEGATYQFFVKGLGDQGRKRDPHARELTIQPAFPAAHCIVVDPSQFPWHDHGYVPPAFNDLVIYQFHVGTFTIAPGKFNGRLLDVLDKLPYLVALGVNAIQPLPIVEFPTEFSLGYNGTDYFSPEGDYEVSDPVELQQYLSRINHLLAVRGQTPYPLRAIAGASNQLRALVDVCHVYGIAVLLDVVYNHAGGDFDPGSMYFFDQMPNGNNNDSLYFTDQGWAGGLVFAYWNQDVRQFLIDNAVFYLNEFHVDGFRYDEVSVIDRFGGWYFCRDLTRTVRYVKPQAIQIAEYWPVNPYIVLATGAGGAGFDSTWHDGLRDAIRDAIAQAAQGRDVRVDCDRVAVQLQYSGLPDAWRAVQSVEDHDLVRDLRRERVAKLADPSNSRSWYGRSRARVATGLVLTAPGIPMLFMGQEFLEDKQWSDDPNSGHLIWWGGLASGDKAMVDHLRFTQELIQWRRRHPGLRAGSINVFHVHNENRVLAFQRWIEGAGRDIVVVASLNESTLYNYELGFPSGGQWLELFNSDVYDNWVNPWAAGNGGAIAANGPGRHGLPASASIVIPANSILVFARDAGD